MGHLSTLPVNSTSNHSKGDVCGCVLVWVDVCVYVGVLYLYFAFSFTEPTIKSSKTSKPSLWKRTDEIPCVVHTFPSILQPSGHIFTLFCCSTYSLSHIAAMVICQRYSYCAVCVCLCSVCVSLNTPHACKSRAALHQRELQVHISFTKCL